jgi:hypothetical protein
MLTEQKRKLASYALHRDLRDELCMLLLLLIRLNGEHDIK